MNRNSSENRSWMDTGKSAGERADLLLAEMTLKEKAGQLNQKLYGFRIYDRKGDTVTLKDEFYKEVENCGGLGALYGLYRSDPWSERDYENGLCGEMAIKLYNEIQKYVMEHSRLHIPVMMSSECPHGHQALDGYLLPVNLAAGATFHPELLRKAYRVCGSQLKGMGAHLALCSMLDMLRDPRWGRSEECYGEDPFLSSNLAAAAITGLHEGGVQVVAKHFAAQGESTGGVNASAARIGEHELREIHLPAMQGAVKAGVRGVMAAYNEIDGIYCHANRKLLTELLRNEFGFDGIVMADALAIDQLDKMTGDGTVSAGLALRAGVDVGLLDEAYSHLEEAVGKGLITEDEIDQAVRRVLKLKFEAGIFEHPFVEENMLPEFSYEEYPESLNLARESVILLKNRENSLPLENAGSILVTGPNADDIYSQLGDYTPPVRKNSLTTVYQGIHKQYPEAEILFAKGSDLTETTEEMLLEAEEKAEKCDVSVVVLGSSSSRFTAADFDANGAARLSDHLYMDCGEGMDRSELNIPEAQMRLFRAVRAKSKKVITVVIAGRPMIINEVEKESDALLLSFYPGPCGGQAIAEILRGIVNPSGRLPVSLPRANGQLPVYYNYKSSYQAMHYLDEKQIPLFSFGYGLDYTEYTYTGVKLEKKEITEEQLQKTGVELQFKVKNAGDREGFCVPQLYITDLQASVVRRVRELKGFTKIRLKPGEEKEAGIWIAFDELALYNCDMNKVVEPGMFRIVLMDQDRELWQGELKVTE